MNATTEIILSEKNIQFLKLLASKITEIPSIEPELYCKQAKELSEYLPTHIKESLMHFSEFGSNKGFLLINNISLDDTEIPDTPNGNTFKIGEQTILSKIQAILTSYVGEMIAYEAEGYGRLFQDVVPIYSMATNQTSLGSRIELENHTEQCFSKLRPDILSLACLRGDENAFTYIMPVQTVIRNLTDEEIKYLREPNWTTGVDLSFKMNGNEFIDGDIRGPFPIISGSMEDPHFLFDQDLMKGINEESQQMVSKIIEIYKANREIHNLKPGEIVLIDNRRAVHGRSAFLPKYNGTDRFLIRCFATFDYKKSEYAREQRTVKAIYS
jgi:L-asparagine oxygenase